MAITDAQFAAWLRTDAARTVLVEQDFGYESGGVPAVGTICLSDTGYNTSPTDSPPSTRYRSTIKQLPTLKRAIDKKKLGGRSEISVSDLRLINLDGALDYLLDVVLDGYENRVYLGAPEGTPGWTRADFRLVFAGVAERVYAPNDNEIVIRLRDKRLLLDRHVGGNQVGGAGVEANQFLPLLYGSCFNVEARLYDASIAKYAVLSNYGAGAVVFDVRDNGVSLAKASVNIWNSPGPETLSVDAGTDVFTQTAHGLAVNDVVWFKTQPFPLGQYGDFAPFAGLTSGQQYWVTSVPTANTFTLSATKGGGSVNVTSATYLGGTGYRDRMYVRRWYDDLANTGRIELSSSATGRVTVDLIGGNQAGGPFTFLEDLIEGWGKVTASDIDSAAFSAGDGAYAVKIGTIFHNYAVLSRENLLDVLDRLSLSAFGWVGFSRLGKITCGLVDVSGIATATPTRTLTQNDLAAGADLSIENDAISIGRIAIEYNRNYTLQGDGLAASVSESNRRLYAIPFGGIQRSTEPSGTAYATNKPFYHRTMVEGEPVPQGEISDYQYGIVGVTLAMPTGIADEIVADAAPHRQFITAKCRLAFFDAELGEVVRIVYPRYGMASGVNARLIEIDLDLTAGEITLGFVRQSTPDTATARH